MPIRRDSSSSIPTAPGGRRRLLRQMADSQTHLHGGAHRARAHHPLIVFRSCPSSRKRDREGHRPRHRHHRLQRACRKIGERRLGQTLGAAFRTQETIRATRRRRPQAPPCQAWRWGGGTTPNSTHAKAMFVQLLKDFMGRKAGERIHVGDEGHTLIAQHLVQPVTDALLTPGISRPLESAFGKFTKALNAVTETSLNGFADRRASCHPRHLRGGATRNATHPRSAQRRPARPRLFALAAGARVPAGFPGNGSERFAVRVNTSDTPHDVALDDLSPVVPSSVSSFHHMP